MSPDSSTDTTMRHYEIGYVIAPVVPEDDAKSMADNIQEAVADKSGEVLASQAPEMQELAYTMEAETSAGTNTFDQAQFGWTQFQLDPAHIDDIKAVAEDTEDILRSLVIKIGADMVGEPSQSVQQEGEADNEDQEDKSEESDEENSDNEKEETGGNGDSGDGEDQDDASSDDHDTKQQEEQS